MGKDEGVAEVEFTARRTSNPVEHQRWRQLAKALLETAALGLPSSLLERLLANEYGLWEIPETKLRRLQSALLEDVVTELSVFQEDTALDMVTKGLGLSGNEGMQKLLNQRNPNSSDAALRNALIENRSRALRWLDQLNKDSDSTNPSTGSQRQINKTMIELRGESLGGRVTRAAMSAAVRHEEVSLSAEDLIIALTFALRASGYSLAATTRSDFVLELPEDEACDDNIDRIRRITVNTARQLLKGVPAPVVLEVVREW